MTPQPGILPGIPALGRAIEFRLVPDAHPAGLRDRLAALSIDEGLVIGLGPSLAQALGAEIPALRAFPALSGGGVEIPSTQADLMLWLRSDDRGKLLLRGHEISATLAPALRPRLTRDLFRYLDGHDLSGYEDGTENPLGEAAREAAFARSDRSGLHGSSFLAVQSWRHDLTHLFALARDAQDDIIGRHLSDNAEFDTAPASAHVKRTAQESFEPEAFILRRSMPWADAGGEGLHFMAFGHSFDAFEAQLRRMAGLDDGITDGLFRFSSPETGSYFWCPPVLNGRLDLRLAG